MGSVKGCINKECIANQKKIALKKGDDYCFKCGDSLYYVCKKCQTQLPDDSEKYCVRCLAEKQDSQEQKVKIVGGAAMALVGLVGKMVLNGKTKEK